MHIPKPVLFAVALIGAAFMGWMLHTSAGSSAGATAAPALATESAASSEAAPRPLQITVELADPRTELERDLGTDLGTDPGTGPPGLRTRPDFTTQSTEQLATTSSRPRALASALEPTTMTTPPMYLGAPAGFDGPAYLGGTAGVPGLQVIANGNHIVVAAQGSIVSVGDNTVVKGNTGDAAASGQIAVDVAGSDLTSGSSSGVQQYPVGTQAPVGWTTYPLHALNSGASPPPGALSPPITSAQAQALQRMVTGGSVADYSAAGIASRAIGIAGYEDHSVNITGDDNLATYDDSDLFFHRNGMLNGNTGDTDTSGLNVVDSIGSRVRSGDSGNSDETPDPPPFDPSDLGSPARTAALLNNPNAGGAGGGASVSISDINGISTATGQDSLVVGGDGMDDNGVRIRGNRNVATYDDGNVAIGGTGNVNAQIGDSDTSGAVVMGVRYSDVAAGNSFLPAWQQAGAQVGDPFDGNDPDLGPPDAPTPRLSAPPVAPTSTPTTATP